MFIPECPLSVLSKKDFPLKFNTGNVKQFSCMV